MGSASDTVETALGKAVLQNTTYTSGSPLFFALGVAPVDDTTFTEIPNANSYARWSVTMNATNWPEDGTIKGKFSNNVVSTSPTATGSWGTPTFWALTTSGTYGAGTVVVWGAIDAATVQPISTGQAASFAVGTIVVTFD
jgi:hypothetical protein